MRADLTGPAPRRFVSLKFSSNPSYRQFNAAHLNFIYFLISRDTNRQLSLAQKSRKKKFQIHLVLATTSPISARSRLSPEKLWSRTIGTTAVMVISTENQASRPAQANTTSNLMETCSLAPKRVEVTCFPPKKEKTNLTRSLHSLPASLAQPSTIETLAPRKKMWALLLVVNALKNWA